MGTDDVSKRVRESLKTRDYARAIKLFAQRMAAPTSESVKSRTTVKAAVEAFEKMKAAKASETVRKYKRVMGLLAAYCERSRLQFVDEINVQALDGYVLERRKETVTWLKEVEILRSFFTHCQLRQWCTENPAKAIERPKGRRNEEEIVPYTLDEVVHMLSACDRIGRTSYERLRARAMVSILRFTGMRIGDVITLSQDHVQGGYIKRHAIKNGRLLRVIMHPAVTAALERLPRPKAASQESKMYFAGEGSSVRSLVKGAERTLSAVFKLSGVEGAFPHRFRHTFASELLGKGESVDVVAAILGDTPAIIRRHYAKWTPEYQSRKDTATQKIHGTELAQTEESVKPC